MEIVNTIGYLEKEPAELANEEKDAPLDLNVKTEEEINTPRVSSVNQSTNHETGHENTPSAIQTPVQLLHPTQSFQSPMLKRNTSIVQLYDRSIVTSEKDWSPLSQLKRNEHEVKMHEVKPGDLSAQKPSLQQLIRQSSFLSASQPNTETIKVALPKSFKHPKAIERQKQKESSKIKRSQSLGLILRQEKKMPKGVQIIDNWKEIVDQKRIAKGVGGNVNVVKFATKWYQKTVKDNPRLRAVGRGVERVQLKKFMDRAHGTFKNHHDSKPGIPRGLTSFKQWLDHKLTRMSTEIPPPVRIQVWEECYPILLKTTQLYERQLGIKSEITKKSIQRLQVAAYAIGRKCEYDTDSSTVKEKNASYENDLFKKSQISQSSKSSEISQKRRQSSAFIGEKSIESGQGTGLQFQFSKEC